MSAAYERVRKALEGTPLAGDLDRMNAELHLTPDSPEWVIASLALIGSSALREDLRSVERRLARLPETLDEAMRASAAEIVRGLASDIASATTTAIKDDTLPIMQRVAEIMAEHVAGLVADVHKATQESTNSASADIAATSSTISSVSSALARGVAKVGGWTPARIASIAFGVLIAASMFAAGNAVHAADVVLGCPTRVQHITRGLHLTGHDANAVRTYICKG